MKNRQIAPHQLPQRSTIAVAIWLALSLGLASEDSYAFGLGEPEILSALGQPLQMRIPLQADASADLSPQCLHLLGSPQDALPTLTAARLSIEENGKDRILRIDSLNPINEPILRVIVDAGCGEHLRREFTLLLDPPVASSQSPVFGPVLGATLSASGSTNVGPADETIAGQVGDKSALELGVAPCRAAWANPFSCRSPSPAPPPPVWTMPACAWRAF